VVQLIFFFALQALRTAGHINLVLLGPIVLREKAKKDSRPSSISLWSGGH
jgi:hypothetical protein